MLTFDKIATSAKRLGQLNYTVPMMDSLRCTSRLYGHTVIVHQDKQVPKHQLAPGDYITPEYRKEIDQWLIDFLGTTTVQLIDDGRVITVPNLQQMHMNPRTFEQLCAAQEVENSKL